MQLQIQKSQLASAGRAARPGRRSCLSVRAIAEPPAKLAEPGTQTQWKPSSWQARTAHQQPKYPDQEQLKKACDEIRSYPPLIFAGECRNLQERLAKAAVGEAFILQGGDCAEAFTQFSANRIRDTYRVLLQMSVVMMFGGGVPVIKLGRMAGQFAKPRWGRQARSRQPRGAAPGSSRSVSNSSSCPDLANQQPGVLRAAVAHPLLISWQLFIFTMKLDFRWCMDNCQPSALHGLQLLKVAQNAGDVFACTTARDARVQPAPPHLTPPVSADLPNTCAAARCCLLLSTAACLPACLLPASLLLQVC
jgi:hypothetical protein